MCLDQASGEMGHGQDVEALARTTGVRAYRPRVSASVLVLHLASRAVGIYQRREHRGPHLVWRKNLD